MHWLYLGIAIIAEIAATSALKSADGFTRLWPSLLVISGYMIAFYFLSLTLRSIPLGITYAIWSGVGIALLAVIGWWFYQETLDLAAFAGIGFIILGILILLLFSNVEIH